MRSVTQTRILRSTDAASAKKMPPFADWAISIHSLSSSIRKTTDRAEKRAKRNYTDSPTRSTRGKTDGHPQGKIFRLPRVEQGVRSVLEGKEDYVRCVARSASRSLAAPLPRAVDSQATLPCPITRTTTKTRKTSTRGTNVLRRPTRVRRGTGPAGAFAHVRALVSRSCFFSDDQLLFFPQGMAQGRSKPAAEVVDVRTKVDSYEVWKLEMTSSRFKKVSIFLAPDRGTSFKKKVLKRISTESEIESKKSGMLPRLDRLSLNNSNLPLASLRSHTRRGGEQRQRPYRSGTASLQTGSFSRQDPDSETFRTPSTTTTPMATISTSSSVRRLCDPGFERCQPWPSIPVPEIPSGGDWILLHDRFAPDTPVPDWVINLPTREGRTILDDLNKANGLLRRMLYLSYSQPQLDQHAVELLPLLGLITGSIEQRLPFG